ncbi:MULTISPECIES: hypothetical protein [unclassified Saccharicrinis]|uniref:hypothetical protein n=1 Tax=unclassified Saccharicrinis TaxID=2646859 RepID=UPI003D3532C2
MKTSGKKVVIMFTAAILVSMLMVPVLPAGDYINDSYGNEIDADAIPIDECFDSSNISVNFSIGRELTIRL